jgi:hypothetical protein
MRIRRNEKEQTEKSAVVVDEAIVFSDFLIGLHCNGRKKVAIIEYLISEGWRKANSSHQRIETLVKCRQFFLQMEAE